MKLIKNFETAGPPVELYDELYWGDAALLFEEDYDYMLELDDAQYN